MGICKQSILLFLVAFVAFSKTSAADFCTHDNEDPFQGREVNEEGYPKEKIQAAIEGSREVNERAITEDAKIWDVISSASNLTWLPPTSSSSLCSSNFQQIFTKGWYFLNIPNLGTCWVLHQYWNYPLTYVNCKTGKCINMPCDSILMNYNCVATNYKTYAAWTWCTQGGFQYRKFRLPQCCECRRFKC